MLPRAVWSTTNFIFALSSSVNLIPMAFHSPNKGIVHHLEHILKHRAKLSLRGNEAIGFNALSEDGNLQVEMLTGQRAYSRKIVGSFTSTLLNLLETSTTTITLDQASKVGPDWVLTRSEYRSRASLTFVPLWYDWLSGHHDTLSLGEFVKHSDIVMFLTTFYIFKSKWGSQSKPFQNVLEYIFCYVHLVQVTFNGTSGESASKVRKPNFLWEGELEEAIVDLKLKKLRSFREEEMYSERLSLGKEFENVKLFKDQVFSK